MDLVGVNQNDVWADLYVWGEPEAATYGFFKGPDGVALMKACWTPLPLVAGNGQERMLTGSTAKPCPTLPSRAPVMMEMPPNHEI